MRLLASTGWGGLLRLWDPQSGRQLFTTQSGMVPQFSRDDRFLAGDLQSDGRLGLWEVAAGGGEYRTLLRHPSEGKGIYDCLSIDKTGSLLAVGMQDGFCLWDLASGWQVGSLPKQHGGVMRAVLHPDGRSVAFAGLWKGDAIGPASPKYAFTPTSGPNKGKAKAFPSCSSTQRRAG